MLDWIAQNQELLTVLGVLGGIAFLGSIFIVPVIIIYLPADFLTRPRRVTAFDSPYRMAVYVLKNCIGVLFLLAGILMLFLPGQGILTILLGLSMVNFPGKRRLQLKIIRHPRVYRSVQWLRRKAKRDNLIVPRKAVPRK